MLSSWRHNPADPDVTPPWRHLWLLTMNITIAAMNTSQLSLKNKKTTELSKKQKQKKTNSKNSAVTNLQSPAKSSCFVLQRETKAWNNIKFLAPHRSGHLCPSGSADHSGKAASGGTWHLYFSLQLLPHFTCWALRQILWKELSVSYQFCSAPGI